MKRKNYTIKTRWLLGVYAVIPVSLLLVVADATWMSGWVKARLPDDPNQFFWFTFVFTLPHILASFFGFFDKEYIDHYGSRLLRSAQIAALLAIVLPAINITLTFYVFSVYTMVHVFLQQSGVAKMLMRGYSNAFRYWQWLGALMSSMIYVGVYGNHGYEFMPLLYGLVGVLYMACGFYALKVSKTEVGTRYFIATHFLPLVTGAFLIMGYPLLAIAIPRIVHDVTGFIFYIAHDSNRHHQSASNFIYRFSDRLGVPVVVVSPLLAVAISAGAQYVGESSYTMIILMAMFLFHYRIEAFMWKGNSLHRRYISVS